MRSIDLRHAAAALALALAVPAAAQQTGNLNVSVQVDEICVFGSSRYELPFGRYGPDDANAIAPLDAQVSIAVRCVGGLNAWVLLFPGNYPGNGSTLAAPIRRMTDGRGSYIRYDLYQDPARTVPWGATQASAPALVGETGVYRAFVIYGRMPSGQQGVVGNYYDRVIVNYTM